MSTGTFFAWFFLIALVGVGVMRLTEIRDSLLAIQQIFEIRRS